jgi:hypothetical protein
MGRQAQDEEWFLAEQETLAAGLERMGRNLRHRREADPEVATETAPTALATIRTWIGAETVLAGAAGVRRERPEEWERELAADAAYCSALRQALHRDIHLSLRERNRRRPDL